MNEVYNFVHFGPWQNIISYDKSNTIGENLIVEKTRESTDQDWLKVAGFCEVCSKKPVILQDEESVWCEEG